MMKKILLLLAFILPSVSYAAIAFDASFNIGNQWQACNPTCTNTFTTGALSNTVIMMGVNNGNGFLEPYRVSINGASTTRAGKQNRNDNAGKVLMYSFAPTTTVNYVAIQWASNQSSVIAGGISYTGVDTTDPNNNKNCSGIGAAGGTSMTATLTTGKNNAWLTGFSTDGSGAGGLSAGTNSYSRYNLSGHYMGSDTNGPQTPVGSKSMVTACSGGCIYDILMMCELAPAASTPSVAKPLQNIILFE